MSKESIDTHTVANAEDGSTADGNECPMSGSSSAVHRHDSQSFAKYICRRKFNVVIVSVVIVTIWVLLALPTIFYLLPKDFQIFSSQAPTDVLCIPEKYTGSICRPALMAQQNCLLDGNATSDIFIAMDSASSQSAKEDQASLVVGGLPFLAPSPECVQAAVPFLCSYVFPLCDSSGRLYQPSSAECRAITDNICAREFETANQFLQCQLLPETTVECNATEDTFANSEDLELGNNSSSRERVCSEGFYVDESTGLCTAECGVWEEFPHNFIVGIDTVVILSAVIAVLGSAVVLVFSCISYKRMFSFPSVFIVYSVIVEGVAALIILIGYTDRTSLFCSSRDLGKSVENSTPFCRVQGQIFNYAILVIEIFWLFHILIVLWGIVFPFHAKNFKRRGYFRYIHIIMVVIAIALPWESLGAVFGTGGPAIAHFPPFLCVPKNSDAIFYSYLLPLSIINATGISLITIVLSVIITKARNSSKINRGGMGKAKVKLMIVFFYFFLASILILTIFSIIAKNRAPVTSELTAYFICESQGIQPGKTCERKFFQQNRIVEIISDFVLSVYPCVNLVYVINVNDVKKVIKRFSRRKQAAVLQNPLTSVSSI